jgi:hypothetical protein
MTPYLIEQLGRLHAEELRQARAHTALVREVACRARAERPARRLRLHAPTWLRRGGFVAGCEG